MKNSLSNYQVVDTLGKNQLELVIKVYDGAISNLKQAVEYYQNNNTQAGYDSMEQAKKFVVHLYTTLDEKKGGEIAKNLSQLYAFTVEQINFVQATKDISKINDSIEIFNNIREGWIQLNKKNKGAGDGAEKHAQVQESAKGISFSL
jgi:flagellar protein FliS